jgi:Calcineurin-like phosphoesterase
MRILHISDLHITTPGETLESVWGGPGAVLSTEGAQFDFVVVSGDLSQHAGEGEYLNLLRFANDHLVPLVHPKERERVIFVPGNHDVDWETEIGRKTTFQDHLAAEGKTDARRFFAELQRAPDRADARYTVSPKGELEIVKIDEDRYQDRFRHVQQFLNRFYDRALGFPHRPFDLTSSKDSDHWSAHVFPEQGVAFYGFSSCHRNDRYWHGATISRLAINRAAEHAREHAKDLLRVAVWHHGITGEPGRPDHLTLLDIGELHNADFRIGLHGHTHEASGEILDKFFGDRFVVVGTGSLGASSIDRPDAVGKQFSIVRLFPGQATVEVWERRNVGVFRQVGEPRFYLLPRGDERRSRISRAESHARQITVRDDGIADVAVSLKKLTVEGRLTLAVIPRHHGVVWAAPDALTGRGLWRVIRDDRPDGTVRFSLASNDSYAETLEWNYKISNAHLLSDEELRLASPDGRVPPSTVNPDEQEYRSHEVHFPTNKLEVVIRYDPSLPGIAHENVARIVDHRRDDGGNEWWESVPDEARAPRFRLTRNETHCVGFEVEAPLVGHRYSAAYKLKPRGSGTLEDRALQIARTVLARTRRERTGGDGLSTVLSTALEESLTEVFPETVGPGLSMVGFLWHPEERHLLAAYGRLNNSHWGARFAFGAGVAGHAFRFASTATWHRRRPSKTSLIYRPSSEARAIYGTDHPHQWIVSVPILTTTGAALGVVSFGSREAETNTEFILAHYAEHAGTENARLEPNLRFVVNYAFWETLAGSTAEGNAPRSSDLVLPALLSDYATQVVQWLDRTAESDSPEPIGDL